MRKLFVFFLVLFERTISRSFTPRAWKLRGFGRILASLAAFIYTFVSFVRFLVVRWWEACHFCIRGGRWDLGMDGLV